MVRTIEDIPAGEATDILAKQGILPDKKVTVLVDETPVEIAERIRSEAARRGMTDEVFDDLMRAR